MTRNAVCLCTDRNMLMPALYVASAAARSAAGAYDVHIMAEASELEDAHRAWMAAHGIQAVGGLAFPRLHRTSIASGRLTPATLIRLLMPGILAQRYDRVLYLDCDTELCGDIAPLFALDLGGRPLAAAPAARIDKLIPQRVREARTRHFRALGMTKPFRYFNSGVMLIDIARWNAEQVGERALEFVERHAELCRLPDEDALNAVLDGRIAELSPIWNHRTSDMTLPRVAELIAPVIRHYDGPHKPWKRFADKRRLFRLEAANRRYRRFMATTPWRDWLDRQWSGADLLANLRFEWTVLADRLRRRPTRGLRTRKDQRKHFKAYRDFIEDQAFADVIQGIAVRRDGRLMANPAAGRAP